MKKIALFLIPLVLTACSQKDEDLAAATKEYDSLKSTTNSNSLTRIADSMRNTGNYGTAIKSYEQAIQIDPTQWTAHIGLSNCLRETGRADAALEVLNRVPLDERDLAWYKELGGVHMAAQNPKMGIEAYTQSLALDPANVGSLNGIGVCNDMMGQHIEAQRWYRSAIEKSPADNRLKSNLGLSLALSSRANEAVDILKEVVESPDATPRDRQNLAVAYGVSGDLESAAKMFAQDLDEKAVRMNLAFVHKLASTQHLIPAQATNGQTSSDAYQTNLAAEAPKQPSPNVEPATPSAAPIDHPSEQSPAQPIAVENPISRDTHVMVNPLPLDEPYPQTETSRDSINNEQKETKSEFTLDEIDDLDNLDASKQEDTSASSSDSASDESKGKKTAKSQKNKSDCGKKAKTKKAKNPAANKKKAAAAAKGTKKKSS